MRIHSQYLILGAAALVAAIMRNELTKGTPEQDAGPGDLNGPNWKPGLTVTETEALGAARYNKLQRPSLSEIPDSVIMATIEVESNFDPAAHGTAGEIGLMQIRVPLTWDDAIVRGKLPKNLDPYSVGDNLLVGMTYLRLVRSELQAAGIVKGSSPADWVLVDQGYNIGPGAVKAGKANEPRKGKFLLARDKYLRAGLA